MLLVEEITLCWSPSNCQGDDESASLCRHGLDVVLLETFDRPCGRSTRDRVLSAEYIRSRSPWPFIHATAGCGGRLGILLSDLAPRSPARGGSVAATLGRKYEAPASGTGARTLCSGALWPSSSIGWPATDISSCSSARAALARSSASIRDVSPCSSSWTSPSRSPGSAPWLDLPLVTSGASSTPSSSTGGGMDGGKGANSEEAKVYDERGEEQLEVDDANDCAGRNRLSPF
mmetsp:Transcript_4381/g.13924  ORF Transcript_4381/g.13924 Transcript_4381/m.13924 type:complete len:232 (-) Transcript_4381:20-715(-)